MSNKLVTLDVRPDFRAGLHPCDKIKGALQQVSAGESLRLLVPFEPVPLYQLATQFGLQHQSNPAPNGDWEVLFSHNSQTATAPRPSQRPACGCGCNESEPSEVRTVDARGLQPPLPMVRVLEALQDLPEHARLTALTDRRPLHLMPILDARGFRGESEEQPDGSFVTHICRV